MDSPRADGRATTRAVRGGTARTQFVDAATSSEGSGAADDAATREPDGGDDERACAANSCVEGGIAEAVAVRHDSKLAPNLAPARALTLTLSLTPIAAPS